MIAAGGNLWYASDKDKDTHTQGAKLRDGLLYEEDADMNKLFDYANQYVKESDWKDLALVKFCLCAMGILIGLSLPEKYKKPVAACAAFVFVASYIPLMRKFFGIVFGKKEE